MVYFWENKPSYQGMRAGQLFWRGTLNLQRGVVVLLSLYTVVLVVAEVVFRYFLKLSIMWVEELTLYLVFWFYLIGASLCTHDHSHIKGGVLNIVFRNLPRITMGFAVGISLLSLGLSCLFAWWGYETFTSTIEINRRTVQLTLPYAYARLSLVPGFALMAVYFLAEAVEHIRTRGRWH